MDITTAPGVVCRLWASGKSSALEEAAASGLPYAPLCAGTVYLRNLVDQASGEPLVALGVEFNEWDAILAGVSDVLQLGVVRFRAGLHFDGAVIRH